MKKLLTFLLLIFLASGLLAQESPGPNHSTLTISCKTCHTCDVPTKNDPCLVACPRNNMTTVYQKPEQTPELIVINELSDRYGPVYFSHKLHAQMSVMSGGCINCHHHNTAGPILNCNSCHETSRKRTDVSVPDLRAAFHRQCMDCHRGWSHETGCNTCHALKKDIKAGNKQNLSKLYGGKNHPVVLEPTKLVYETNSEKGKLVTFFHSDHTKRFGLECTNCHKQENCTKCHDVNKKVDSNFKQVTEKKSFEEQHKNCISCHKDDNCNNCHSETESKSFDHAKTTGWELNRFHINLTCNKCHGTEIPFKKLDNKCVSCHKDWNNETFKHSVTGLELNETHLELSCEDCHINGNFTAKPSCDNCHENDSFPKQKPGKLLNNN
jgi:Class III cytochrome C family/Cytochrome c3